MQPQENTVAQRERCSTRCPQRIQSLRIAVSFAEDGGPRGNAAIVLSELVVACKRVATTRAIGYDHG